jgi:hypothetical protein
MKCILSAIGGALAAVLALSPADRPLNLGSSARAAQSRSPAVDATSGPIQNTANVKLDDANVIAHYSNYVRVTATPEEVIFDFGLNPQPFATGEQSVKVSERLVLNFFTAKRLLMALQRTIERHESTFGPIELDVRKRAKPGDNDE